MKIAIGDQKCLLQQILRIVPGQDATGQIMKQRRLKPSDQFLEAGGATAHTGAIGAFLRGAFQRWMAARGLHE